MAIAFPAEGVLSSDMWRLLECAYREMRQARTADGVGDSFVAWSEGFARGAVEAVSLCTGFSQDELLGWLQRRFTEQNDVLVRLVDT